MKQARWTKALVHVRLLARVMLALALLWGEAPVHAQMPDDAPAGAPAFSPRAITPNSNDEIAYIDFQGYIRTYDPEQPDVQWISPTGGWRDLALGDFTGDGDMEIVAIAGGKDDGRLAIYDPVVASGAVNPANNYSDDIYWDVLFETALPAAPRLVTSGAFLAGSAGIGIAVVYDDPDAPNDLENDTRIRIYAPANSPPDGRQWRILADNRRNASRIAAGNIDDVGSDDLVVVDRVGRSDSELVAISVQPDGAFVRLYDDETTGVGEWVDATVGRVDPAYTGNDVAAIRESSLTTPRSLYVIRYLGSGNISFVYQRSFVPSPFTIFRGDINRDGADELFFLRTQSCNPAAAASGSNPPQLFMRTMSTGVADFEVCLDGDSAFKRGATGDLDGDGNIEVVMVSQYQMRIFTQPESSTTTFTNVAVASNTIALAVGNLDANGNATTARLAVTTASIDTSLQAGTRVGPLNMQIFNGAGTDTIEFTVATIPSAGFVSWTLSGNQTNANLGLSLDAAALLPGGVYGVNLVITAKSTQVANSPLVIPVIVRVTGVAVNPPRQVLLKYPCNRDSGPLETITRTMTIVGDQVSWGRTFSVTVEPPTSQRGAGVAPRIDWPSRVDWVTASSPTMTIPSTLEVIVDPNQATDDDTALIVLTSPLDETSSLQYTTQLHFICTDHAIFMPLMQGN